MEASSKQWRRKSQTLMEASSPSPSSSSKQMWMKSQSLYICFAGIPNGYAIHSISHFWRRCLHQEPPPLIEVSQSRHGRNRRTPAPPLNEVSRCKLPHEMTPPPPLSEVWRHHDEDEMGLLAHGCVRLDSKIYFVGSIHPKPRSVDDKSVLSYNLADRSVAFYPDMSFRKCAPIVFSANNRIFVLSKPILDLDDSSDEELYLRRESLVVPDPVPLFEVFDLSTQKWETLDPPPFFDPHSAYYGTCNQMKSHAVIGGYICISTTDASFKFKIDVDDVETMIWEPCMLFEDHPKPNPSRLRHIRKYIDPACGSPFPFRGRAILFGAGNDILISMGVNELVAYKMVGDRVVNSQSFNVPRLAPTTTISYIGNGLLCLVFITDYQDFYNNSLFVKLLRLNEKEVGNKFLQCEVVNEFLYDFENSEMWFPIYCFVH